MGIYAMPQPYAHWGIIVSIVKCLQGFAGTYAITAAVAGTCPSHPPELARSTSSLATWWNWQKPVGRPEAARAS
jgi:hypothetical protein